MSTLTLRPARAASDRDIHCPTCRKLIFDGEVLLARVTRFNPAGAEACCKICKTWVPVPVTVTVTAPDNLEATRLGVSWAVFALGRFVDYRLVGGMEPKLLEPFIETYLELAEVLDGQAPLSDPELRSRTASALQEVQQGGAPAWQSWLTAHDERRRLRRASCKSPSTSAPGD